MDRDCVRGCVLPMEASHGFRWVGLRLSSKFLADPLGGCRSLSAALESHERNGFDETGDGAKHLWRNRICLRKSGPRSQGAESLPKGYYFPCSLLAALRS